MQRKLSILIIVISFPILLNGIVFSQQDVSETIQDNLKIKTFEEIKNRGVESFSEMIEKSDQQLYNGVPTLLYIHQRVNQSLTDLYSSKSETESRIVSLMLNAVLKELYIQGYGDTYVDWYYDEDGHYRMLMGKQQIEEMKNLNRDKEDVLQYQEINVVQASSIDEVQDYFIQRYKDMTGQEGCKMIVLPMKPIIYDTISTEHLNQGEYFAEYTNIGEPECIVYPLQFLKRDDDLGKFAFVQMGHDPKFWISYGGLDFYFDEIALSSFEFLK